LLRSGPVHSHQDLHVHPHRDLVLLRRRHSAVKHKVRGAASGILLIFSLLLLVVVLTFNLLGD
jgi:hypothetical protein